MLRSLFKSRKAATAPVYVGRQPIFDSDLEVVAYELLYRNGSENLAVFTDGNLATSRVLLNTFVEIGLEKVVGEKPAYINVSQQFVASGHCHALPADRVILELLEDAEPTAKLVDELQRLSKMGYTIALDDFVFRPDYDPLLQIADIVKVDLRKVYQTIGEQVELLKPYRNTLLAEKVETPSQFDLCRELGFDLFQGNFFARPRVLQARNALSDRLSTLRLIAALSDSNVTITRVENLVGQDPALAAKLLKFINSSFCGVSRQVDSIRKATVLVGLSRLRTWATLLAMGQTRDCPRELLVTANVRARMCEILALERKLQEAPSAFIVGLLSVLNVLVGRPLPTVVRDLPLTRNVKDALVDQTGDLGDVLQSVVAYESARNLKLDAQSPQLTKAYIAAVSWSNSMFKELDSAGID